MIRRMLPGVIGLAALMTVTANAGGWGVITVKHLPDFVEVGRPLPLAFTVMPHGKMRAPGLTGTVEAVSGTQRVSVAFSEGKERGLYQASLALPRAGDWVVTINAGYRLTLLPIKAVEPGAGPANALTTAERGQRLFVAKGCVTCHQNGLATANMAVNVGPALVPHKYQAEFLARMLADPAANIPPRPESPVRMPDLGLEQQEITSLVAFINAGVRTAAIR
jgi:cytochrome c551/c552